MIDLFTQDTILRSSQDPAQVTTTIRIDSLEAMLEAAASRLADSVVAGATQIVNSISYPSIWEIGASFSAVVVAAFAIIEGVRIFLSRKEITNRAAARVSSVAFPVRRQIESWLDEVPPEVAQMEERQRNSLHDWSDEDAGTVRKTGIYWQERSAKSDIRTAETRIEEMNAQAPLAAPFLRGQVVAATAAFYQAFDNLNQIIAIPWEPGLDGFNIEHATYELGRTLLQGHRLLKDCTERLDTVVDEEFTKAVEELEADKGERTENGQAMKSGSPQPALPKKS